MNSSYVDRLMKTSEYLSLTINYVSVIGGTIGGCCNIIAYTAPQLRSNPSAFYLLSATFFQLASFWTVITTRMAMDSYGFLLERQSIVFCKLRYYFALTWPQLVTYYVLMATIDRYLVTSPHASVRAWSRIRIAHRLSFAMFVVIHVATVHVLVFYQIQQGFCQVPPGNVYTVFFAIYLIGIISVVPHALMFVFALLTFGNLRKTRQRVVTMSIDRGQAPRTKRREYQLITVGETAIVSAKCHLRSICRSSSFK
jgi:hypothetical protein